MSYFHMDIKTIADIVFKLYLYADETKRIHYSTEKNHTHELCDQVRDTIVDFADTLAEQSFGYYGKPSFSQTPKLTGLDIRETESLAELIDNATELVDYLHEEFSKEKKMSGTVSAIDDYKGEMNKLKFLTTFDKVSGQ